MGKRNRKLNNEEQEQVNVSVDKDIKLFKNSSGSVVVINEESSSIKRTKTNKNICNDNEMHESFVTSKKDKNCKVKQLKHKEIEAPDISSHIESNGFVKKTKKKHKVQEQNIMNINEVSHDELNKKTQKSIQNVVQDALHKKACSKQKNKSESDKGGKKCKENRKVVVPNEVFKENDLQHETSFDISKKVKKKKEENVVLQNDKKDKKKIQQNEEPVLQDEEIEKTNSDNNKTKKKRKRKIVEEEIINDEDIDRYCDELDPFHNKQYEDWVKLIEANLNSNKKV